MAMAVGAIDSHGPLSLSHAGCTRLLSLVARYVISMVISGSCQ